MFDATHYQQVGTSHIRYSPEKEVKVLRALVRKASKLIQHNWVFDRLADPEWVPNPLLFKVVDFDFVFVLSLKAISKNKN
jgi:hypothetical protein